MSRFGAGVAVRGEVELDVAEPLVLKPGTVLAPAGRVSVASVAGLLNV